MNMFGAELDNQLVLAFRESPAEQATAAENRRILMDALEALAAGDADAFWSIFSPDVVFHEAACLPYGGEHHGLAATQQAFGRMTQLFSQIRAEVEAVSAARDIALLYQTITFRVRATGATGSLPVTEMYRFRDGKVVEWRALYFDADMVAGALAGRA
jgi:ketosteroid isomerase-like protein